MFCGGFEASGSSLLDSHLDVTPARRKAGSEPLLSGGATLEEDTAGTEPLLPATAAGSMICRYLVVENAE